MKTEKKFVLVDSCYGHQIGAMRIADELGLKVRATSKKETKEEYEADVLRIAQQLEFFGPVEIVPFEERNSVEGWDIVKDITSRNIAPELWDVLAAAAGRYINFEETPEYEQLFGKKNILFVPQKLVSDGKCGVNAAQQSLPLEVFDFLKTRPADENLVLGQHFNKVADLEKVEHLAEEFNLYVPGMTENEEVFGIRGVAHKLYYNMYGVLSGAVGVAGTHTWYLLTMFPSTPQIILFNKNGVENWKAIEAAYRKKGYPICCIGFDENSDMSELAKEIESAYNEMMR